MRHILPGLLLLVGCSAGGAFSKGDTSHRSEADQKKFEAAIKRGEVKMGMVQKEVRRAWGKPARVDKTTHQGRTVTRWSYTFSEIYFHREGFVVGWRSAYD